MDAKEIDSFVAKFKCLWKTGYNAHLAMDSFSGQVSLHVQLGHTHQRQKFNSRDRRRARRAAERADKTSKVLDTDLSTTEKTSVIETTEHWRSD